MTPATMFVVNTLIGAVNARLHECTSDQVAVFHRVYPGWPDKYSGSEEKLKTALDLVLRTIRKNEADPRRVSP